MKTVLVFEEKTIKQVSNERAEYLIDNGLARPIGSNQVQMDNGIHPHKGMTDVINNTHTS